jgi:hypothetical protein
LTSATDRGDPDGQKASYVRWVSCGRSWRWDRGVGSGCLTFATALAGESSPCAVRGRSSEAPSAVRSPPWQCCHHDSGPGEAPFRAARLAHQTSAALSAAASSLSLSPAPQTAVLPPQILVTWNQTRPRRRSDTLSRNPRSTLRRMRAARKSLEAQGLVAGHGARHRQSQSTPYRSCES